MKIANLGISELLIGRLSGVLKLHHLMMVYHKFRQNKFNGASFLNDFGSVAGKFFDENEFVVLMKGNQHDLGIIKSVK